MSIWDELFKGEEEPRRQGRGGRRRPRAEASGDQSSEELTDEQAIDRYRYLLRTAPPEMIEQAHVEAFERLTPEQRRMVLEELGRAVPEEEQRAARYGEDPQSLARMATRAEMRRPGTLERTFTGLYIPGMGIGLGGMMMGSFFGSFAGMVLGSIIAQEFFDYGADQHGSADEGADGGNQDAGADAGQGDAGAGDPGGYEELGGFDDFGGDFGGDVGSDI